MRRKVCPKCGQANWTEPIERIRFFGRNNQTAELTMTSPIRHCRDCITPLQVVVKFERVAAAKSRGLVWHDARIYYRGGEVKEAHRLIAS